MRSSWLAALALAPAATLAAQSVPVEFELGYRFVDVSGNDGMYRTQINDRPGVLLRSLNYASTGPWAERWTTSASTPRTSARVRRDRCGSPAASSTFSGSTSPGGGPASTARSRPSRTRSWTRASFRASTPIAGRATSTTRRSRSCPERSSRRSWVSRATSNGGPGARPTTWARTISRSTRAFGRSTTSTGSASVSTRGPYRARSSRAGGGIAGATR